MLGEIHALTVAMDGAVFVATASALYIISTLAGFVGHLAGSHSETGYADGEGIDARFNHPSGLAVASDGSLLVADTFITTVCAASRHRAPDRPSRGG